MSDSVRPETAAFRDLQLVVRNMAEEMASFRRRALTAEGRLRELEGQEAPHTVDEASALLKRVEELEQRNGELDAKLQEATARAQQMLERVRFLRQQTRTGTEK